MIILTSTCIIQIISESRANANEMIVNGELIVQNLEARLLAGVTLQL